MSERLRTCGRQGQALRALRGLDGFGVVGVRRPSSAASAVALRAPSATAGLMRHPEQSEFVIWQTRLPRLKAASGKKLLGQIGAGRKSIASGWCVRGKPVSPTRRQSGVSNWKEGGEYRVAMHVAGGALIGGLGGGGIGTAAQGAAGAGISAAAAGKLNELSHDIAASSPTGNADADRALGNIIANVLATGAGAVAGGATGAATASSTDLYNRQLHPDEYARAKKDAKVVAQQLGISEQEAEGRIVAEMLRNSDKQTADASGGVHDYEVRSIIGCQNLNCNGYKNDPQYANHFYNAEYIPLNQVAYTLGQSEIGRGQTYNGLVTSNVQNNPISIALAGAGMMASGVGIGGGLASLGMMGTGSAIGMLANAGVQLYNGQPFDWAGLGMAGLTGGASSGMGFVPGLLINTGGALSSSAAAGQNPNASMAGAALGTLIGYPVGVKIEGRLNDVLNPWYRAEWRDLGMGISTSVPKSPVPSWTGGIGAGVISEISGGAVQNRVNNTK